ncbi:MAG TPA: YbdK family carboxylate-amine ligase [Methylococcus sp.]|nr:YbdK family carboxylate-amine ligase [Methylococcus sp.]
MPSVTHRDRPVFQGNETPSVGVEIEFQLIDPETADLTDRILPLLRTLPDDPAIKAEMTCCTVEINSKVCSGIDELEEDLAKTLRKLQEHCRRLGIGLCAAGTHPFSQRPVAVTRAPRYLATERSMPYLSRRLRTFATHVHVGMPSGDVAVRVMAMLKPYLPLLLALAANSPYWEGVDTAFACFRQRVLASYRDYGMPPDFADWREFLVFFECNRRTGVYQSPRSFHWDVRPSPTFGTLEVRVMDAQSTLAENVTLAAFVYTLSMYLRRCLERDEAGLLPRKPWWLEKLNIFNAAHLGLDSRFIIDDHGHGLPTARVMRMVARALTTTAAELGTAPYLERLERLMASPGYRRQRDTFQRSGDLRAVVRRLMEELETP